MKQMDEQTNGIVNEDLKESSVLNSPDCLSARFINDLDLLSSVFLLLFGIFVFLSGIYMCFFAKTGTNVWYYSPGFFPLFIGSVIILLAVLLFIKKYRSGSRFHSLIQELRKHWKDKRRSARLLLAIGLFAVYVFLLIGHMPFVIATFLYLCLNMFIFRENNFQLWKIVVISAIVTGCVYLFFGVIAAIPLP